MVDAPIRLPARRSSLLHQSARSLLCRRPRSRRATAARAAVRETPLRRDRRADEQRTSVTWRNYRLNKVVVVSPPLLTNAITRPIKRTHRGSLARTPQNKHEKTCYTARQAGYSHYLKYSCARLGPSRGELPPVGREVVVGGKHVATCSPPTCPPPDVLPPDVKVVATRVRRRAARSTRSA